MGRSSGYRPRKEHAEEVSKLREELANTTDTEWIKAQSIMAEITAIMGVKGGPSGYNVMPRSCKLCHYYGHTKENCTRCPNGLPYAEELRLQRQIALDKFWEEDPAGYLDWCMEPYRLEGGEPVRLKFKETVASGGSIEPDGEWDFGGAIEFHRQRIRAPRCNKKPDCL